MSSPSTSHRATVRPRRSIWRVWQVQLLLVGMLDELVARGDAAGPALALGVEASWSTDGASIRQGGSGVADLDVVASRIFGTPVMSAASAIAGSSTTAIATRNL